MSDPLRAALLRHVPEPALQRLQRLRHGESVSLERPVRHRPRGVTPQVVTSFDAHATRADNARAVGAALEAAGIAHAALPGRHGVPRQLAVSAADREATVVALHARLRGDGWVVEPRGGTVRVHRVLSAPGGQVLSGPDTGCEVGFWTPVTTEGRPRPDGGTYEAGTMLAPGRNGVAATLGPDTWRAAVAAPTHWALPVLPELDEATMPVDVVYTWVDGADVAWQERRSRYTADGERNATATAMARYLSRDELRYSLRSVAMYAGWVRRIHIVTDGQVPAWLDTDHPTINVVHHEAVFSDPSVLPVFNSHAIESQLHHIEGLADHYLYLNDDVFLGRPVDPELFFTGSGLAKVFLSPHTLDLDPPSARDLPAISAGKNHRALIESTFGRTVHRKVLHAVHPQRRDVLDEMEQRWPDVFAAVAASRFRDPADISIASRLHHSYALATARAVVGDVRFAYQDISSPDTARKLDTLLRVRPQLFCLNDIDTDPTHLAAQQRLLTDFAGEYFPLPAPWERV